MMFLVNVASAIVVVIISIALYNYVINHKDGAADIGGAFESVRYLDAMKKLWELEESSKSVMNFRPQYVVLQNLTESEDNLVSQAVGLFYKGRGLTVQSKVVVGDFFTALPAPEADVKPLILHKEMKCFSQVLCASSVREGIRSILQSTGIGKVKPNTMAYEFKKSWKSHSDEDLQLYVDALNWGFHLKMGAMVMRNPGALFVGYEDGNAEYRGNIDVYWFNDDGGFTLLIPHLLKLHPVFAKCHLRVFVDVAPGADAEARAAEVRRLIDDLRISAAVFTVNCDPNFPSSSLIEKMASELGSTGQEDDSNFEVHTFLQFAGDIKKNSAQSRLVFMSLPRPTPTASPRNVMLWWDMLSAELPPVIFIHGEQKGVVTEKL